VRKALFQTTLMALYPCRKRSSQSNSNFLTGSNLLAGIRKADTFLPISPVRSTLDPNALSVDFRPRKLFRLDFGPK
jgi:hypothetical protein